MLSTPIDWLVLIIGKYIIKARHFQKYFPTNYFLFSVVFELQHNVCGRRVYAEGTVDAVEFVSRTRNNITPNKRLFNMIDVLESGSMNWRNYFVCAHTFFQTLFLLIAFSPSYSFLLNRTCQSRIPSICIEWIFLLLLIYKIRIQNTK